MNQKKRIARSIADFFSRRYEVRYNMIKGIEEFRPRDGMMHQWQQVTDRDLNRMTFEQMEEGGHGCGSYRSTVDHIGVLARRVPTDYKD